jgi:hypothetical protein
MTGMKSPVALLLTTVAASAVFAAEPASYYNKPVFSDDFTADGFSKRWGHYKSGSVVKDGVLMGITPENSDHSAVDSIKFTGERDLEVSVKFRFVSEKAKSFNVWFDDKDYKGSHAGHICSVTVNPKGVTIADAKTGNFKNEIYTKRKADPKSLSDDEKKMLATKTKNIPASVSLKEWHTLLIQTKGGEVTVRIDGKAVGSFKSEGIAHETKSLVSLTTNPVDVHYDDFSIKAATKP